ncbi:MAG: glutathione S-transferase [marine bacterium B5-7]|nr:MAG: glutathione S-transferase [marine bacterium B5-7]
MKLYSAPLSPNCRRVEATILHLGLEIDVHHADFASGELKSDDFLALNPNGRVPLLIDDGFNLWESNAIIQYLADKAAAEDFYPSDLMARADINRWQFWESLHFNKAVSSICWETLAKPMMNLGTPDETIIAASISAFHPFANVLNKQLDNRAFIMGDTLTLADFSVGCYSIMALHPDSQVPLDDYPNIIKWMQLLERVPAWAQTAPPL